MRRTHLSFISLLWGALPTSAQGITFEIQESSKDGAASLDPAPVSFGFPFATLPGYFDGMPLTAKCLETFRSVTNIWPNIRVGGTSEDHATFDPNLQVPNVATGTAPTGHIITTYGPELMRLLQDYNGTIVWGLNRGAGNLTNTIEAAKAAVREIPNLFALELGNEPDVFGALNMTVADGIDWNPQTEAENESKWQIAVGEAISTDHIIQASSYYQSPERDWGAENYFQFADPSADRYIKVYSHHNYPQSNYPSAGVDPPDVKALMSHVNVTKNVGLYVNDVKAASMRGFDYVFGETNSVSGNGQPGQGDTYATGLWVLNYMLQSTSIGIKRAYFHQGTPQKSYYVWFNETGVQSPFYGGYFAAEALSGGSSIISLDDGSTNYAGYSIHSASGQPMKIVLINTDFFDGTGDRISQEFTLNGLKGTTATARRLTSTTSLSRQASGDKPTFAGQSVGDDTCQFSGEEIIETIPIVNGSALLTLAASEALLITL